MPRTERYKLIDWVLNDDMEGLEELPSEHPCRICGKPCRTFSLSFHASMHLRCCTRLWEEYDARMRFGHAQRMLDLYKEKAPSRQEDDMPF